MNKQKKELRILNFIPITSRIENCIFLFLFFLFQTGLIFCQSETHDNLAEKKIKSQPKHKEQASPSSLEAFKNATITSKIIPTYNNTWGYDILVESKLMIHQPAIPGMPGNEGFKTKEAAQKVADLVVNKIKNGEMPPSITIQELKKLKTF